MTTAIEWTDETWNPTTGCDQVSPGCDNCYALLMAGRLKAMGQAKYQTDGNPATSGPGFGLATHADTLDQPLRWRKPRRVFVNSMSDLFHPKVPDIFITQVWDVMEQADTHTFQVLTKRPARMRAFLHRRQRTLEDHAIAYGHCPTEAMRTSPAARWARKQADLGPKRNIWVGVSVEDQQRADERIPALLDTPAAVRFLSIEPMLGPVDLMRSRYLRPHHCTQCGADWHEPACGPTHAMLAADRGIGWVIVGGESGLGARPMPHDWPRTIRDQCVAAGVPFFFKQWGGRTPKAHGRELDGRTWDEYPDTAEDQT